MNRSVQWSAADSQHMRKEELAPHQGERKAFNNCNRMHESRSITISTVNVDWFNKNYTC